MPIENARLRHFLECWTSARTGGALPSLDDVVARMGDAGLPLENRAVLERSGGRILVRTAGAALRAHFGFDLTGADLLDLTPAAARDIRSQRFAAVVTLPCGMLVRDGMQTALTPGGCIEVLHLPVRDGMDGDVLVMSLHLGFETVAPSRGPIYLGESIEWIDLGAGVPASSTNPLRFGIASDPAAPTGNPDDRRGGPPDGL